MATITDERRPSWCWIDNDVIDTFGPIIGPNAIAVYLVLARHANNETRKAWPSFATIAKMAGISRPTAIKAIGKLVEAGLISAEKRGTGYGDWDSNAYTLLPVKAENSALLGGKGDLPPSKDDQETDGGGKADLPGVVNAVDQGGKGGLLELDSINYTHSELDSENTLTANAVSAPAEPPAAKPAPPTSSRKTKKAQTPPDPNMTHPAVVAFRELARRNPNHVQAQAIAETVTDVDTWRANVTRWLTAGWSPVNVSGMLARYVGGWADIDGRQNGQGLVGNPQPNEPRGFAALRTIFGEAFSGG